VWNMRANSKGGLEHVVDFLEIRALVADMQE
jgi:hypothetical protein